MTVIPAIPADWIDHTDIVSRPGCLPQCIVLRPWNEITPFVVHRAYAADGQWHYENGNYCLSRTTAENSFAARAKEL